jgi:hypothetical protein
MLHLFYDVLMFADLDDGLREAHHDVVNNRIGFQHFPRLRPGSRLRPGVEGLKREGPTKMDPTAAGEVDRRAYPAQKPRSRYCVPVGSKTIERLRPGDGEPSNDCGREIGEGDYR